MTSNQKSEIARTLYLTTEKTQKEICGIVGWTEKTFTEQKQKGNWAGIKDVKGLTKQQIIVLLHQQTLALVNEANNENRLLSAKEIDSVAKLTSSIAKLESKVNIETYIEVFEEFNKWLMGINIKYAQTNNEHQDLFIQSKIKK